MSPLNRITDITIEQDMFRACNACMGEVHTEKLGRIACAAKFAGSKFAPSRCAALDLYNACLDNPEDEALRERASLARFLSIIGIEGLPEYDAAAGARAAAPIAENPSPPKAGFAGAIK